MHSSSLMEVFEGISVEEMKRVEKIAERLFYFDVVPHQTYPYRGGRHAGADAQGELEGRGRGDHPVQGLLSSKLLRRAII